MSIEKIGERWRNNDLYDIGNRECLCANCEATTACPLTPELDKISKKYNMDMIITQCGVKNSSGKLRYIPKKDAAEKAAENLEIACEMIGWDETEFDSFVHTKNFIKSFRKIDDLNMNNAFYEIIYSRRREEREQLLEGIFKSVGSYIEKTLRKKSSHLRENKKESIKLDYLHQIRNKVFEMYVTSVRE
jgi:hypothetical protein